MYSHVGRSIYLDKPELQWQTGQTHILALRKPDGTLSGPSNTSPGNDSTEVIIDPH
jgi:hypothetical protein|tara:strand:- start:290 stop:457 length:168 start_codon:yes stop_codon:yes gene_type:complete